MDKYEYRIRAEEINSLIEQQEYAEAVKIADTIDWRRVRSIVMLCKVSELYKMNRRYEDSKEVLLLAYDQQPGSRKIIYSLCELSIKLEETVQAVEYYKEFVQVAPRDTGRFILQYRLYEAQDVSLEERIAVLEEYKKRDYREKWAYELAYLYHRIGLATRCVEECDELILWFGDGKYVMKAMELKMLHAPLTPQQQEKYNARFMSEMEAIAAVEEEEESRAQKEVAPSMSIEIKSIEATNAKTAKIPSKRIEEEIQPMEVMAEAAATKEMPVISSEESTLEELEAIVDQIPEEEQKPYLESDTGAEEIEVFFEAEDASQAADQEETQAEAPAENEDASVPEQDEDADMKVVNSMDDLDIQIKTIDVGNEYSTINLQEALAKDLAKLLAEEDMTQADATRALPVETLEYASKLMNRQEESAQQAADEGSAAADDDAEAAAEKDEAADHVPAEEIFETTEAENAGDVVTKMEASDEVMGNVASEVDESEAAAENAAIEDETLEAVAKDVSMEDETLEAVARSVAMEDETAEAVAEDVAMEEDETAEAVAEDVAMEDETADVAAEAAEEEAAEPEISEEDYKKEDIENNIEETVKQSEENVGNRGDLDDLTVLFPPISIPAGQVNLPLAQEKPVEDVLPESVWGAEMSAVSVTEETPVAAAETEPAAVEAEVAEPTFMETGDAAQAESAAVEPDEAAGEEIAPIAEAEATESAEPTICESGEEDIAGAGAPAEEVISEAPVTEDIPAETETVEAVPIAETSAVVAPAEEVISEESVAEEVPVEAESIEPTEPTSMKTEVTEFAEPVFYESGEEDIAGVGAPVEEGVSEAAEGLTPAEAPAAVMPKPAETTPAETPSVAAPETEVESEVSVAEDIPVETEPIESEVTEAVPAETPVAEEVSAKAEPAEPTPQPVSQKALEPLIYNTNTALPDDFLEAMRTVAMEAAKEAATAAAQQAAQEAAKVTADAIVSMQPERAPGDGSGAAVPEDETVKVKKQITGQLSFSDIMDEWEKTKKENEEKHIEKMKQKVIDQTGPLYQDAGSKLMTNAEDELNLLSPSLDVFSETEELANEVEQALQEEIENDRKEKRAPAWYEDPEPTMEEPETSIPVGGISTTIMPNEEPIGESSAAPTISQSAALSTSSVSAVSVSQPEPDIPASGISATIIPQEDTTAQADRIRAEALLQEEQYNKMMEERSQATSPESSLASTGSFGTTTVSPESTTAPTGSFGTTTTPLESTTTPTDSFGTTTVSPESTTAPTGSFETTTTPPESTTPPTDSFAASTTPPVSTTALSEEQPPVTPPPAPKPMDTDAAARAAAEAAVRAAKLTWAKAEETKKEEEKPASTNNNLFNTAEINGLEDKLVTALSGQHYDTSSMQVQALSQELSASAESAKTPSPAPTPAAVSTPPQTVPGEKRTLTKEEKDLFGPIAQTKELQQALAAALDAISPVPFMGNAIVTGEEDVGTLKYARAIPTYLSQTKGQCRGKVSTFTFDDLKKKDIIVTLEEHGDGAIIINRAGELSQQALVTITNALQNMMDRKLLLILTDEKQNIDRLKLSFTKLKEYFPAEIDINSLDNNGLVDYGKAYARRLEYSIDAMGVLALYNRIEEKQAIDHAVTVDEVKAIIQEAIESAEKKSLSKFMATVLSKRHDSEDMVVLQEKDFLVDKK